MRKGQKHKPESIAKLRRRVVSEDSRAKMSAAHKGVALTDEHRARIGQALKGRSPSPQHRQRLAESARRHFAENPRPTGPASPHWKGGRFVGENGYVRVYAPDHPRRHAGEYVYEHTLVMEAMLGRYLEPEEVVHHVDGDKQNNAPENLQLCANQAEHVALHSC